MAAALERGLLPSRALSNDDLTLLQERYTFPERTKESFSIALLFSRIETYLRSEFLLSFSLEGKAVATVLTRKQLEQKVLVLSRMLEKVRAIRPVYFEHSPRARKISLVLMENFGYLRTISALWESHVSSSITEVRPLPILAIQLHPEMRECLESRLSQDSLFEATEEIGRGGNGIVHRVPDTRFVIKRIKKENSGLREAAMGTLFPKSPLTIYCRLTPASSHPPLPLLKSYRSAILFPRIEGGDLFDMFDSPTIPLALVAKGVLNVLNQLAHLHSIGVCHYDVKPENIMPNFGLIDYGSTSPFGSAITTIPEHFVHPKAAYEIVTRSESTTSEGFDLWGLGCAIFELLHGAPLYEMYTNSSEPLTLEQQKKVAASIYAKQASFDTWLDSSISSISSPLFQELLRDLLTIEGALPASALLEKYAERLSTFPSSSTS